MLKTTGKFHYLRWTTKFWKILSERFKISLNYINEEQAGFLPNQHIKENIRVVLDMIEYYEKHPDKEVGIIFLDAEKAFDNVNWDFMLCMMEKIEIGNNFLNATKAIYKEQQANLIINSDSVTGAPCAQWLCRKMLVKR